MGMATDIELQLDAALRIYVNGASAGMTIYAVGLAGSLISIYWMFFGFASIRGDVSEPMSKITKDVVRMLLITMVILPFGNYQNYVIEMSQAIVSDLTSRMSGGAAQSPGALIDAIFATCITPTGDTQCLPINTVFAHLAIKHANWYGFPDLSYVLANILMVVAEVVIVVLCLIPILLSKVALAIFMAIGPLFIMLAMFPQTRSYFNSWLSGALGNALTLVIVAGICSVVPLIMKDIVARAFRSDLGVSEVLGQAVGAVIASIGLGLTALKASQMGAQLAGGGVAMDGGNWLGALGNMYTNMKGRMQGGKDPSSKESPQTAAPNSASAQPTAAKPYTAGRAAGQATRNVLDALAKRK